MNTDTSYRRSHAYLVQAMVQFKFMEEAELNVRIWSQHTALHAVRAIEYNEYIN
jgi:hypothetical protein